MPQADLKYTADLKIDAETLLADIERKIATYDSAAGECKGRAFKLSEYHHTHIFLDLQVLQKPHRDEAFMSGLLEQITQVVDGHLTQDCARSIQLGFLSPYYRTGDFSADLG